MAVLRLMIRFQRKIVMRGALIIVMAVSLLIVGILVMKNMGADRSSGVIETQTKQYTQSAKSIADEANERTKSLREEMNRAE
jgi:cytoskeletal protein RodZ